MVELKSGETYNGIIKAVDKFTNIKMEAANLSDKVAQLPFRTVKCFTV
jgi:small nuclear ribonucleoprotein (snRNP)-like protein